MDYVTVATDRKCFVATFNRTTQMFCKWNTNVSSIFKLKYRQTRLDKTDRKLLFIVTGISSSASADGSREHCG